MLNPNVLYLQSTPMTEPLLFGLSLLAVAATAAWLDAWSDKESARSITLPAAALSAACMTRYEAWGITGAVVALSFFVLLRRGVPLLRSARAALQLAAWPTIAIVVFSMNSRWVVGEWVVTGGFFVPENVEALGHPVAAWRQITTGCDCFPDPRSPGVGYAGAGRRSCSTARDRAPEHPACCSSRSLPRRRCRCTRICKGTRSESGMTCRS